MIDRKLPPELGTLSASHRRFNRLRRRRAPAISTLKLFQAGWRSPNHLLPGG
jgi:hypothetical protein